MTHASLFSGIGGPEVAAEMLGWTNLFHCEINPFGRAVLAYHFPESVSYEDITKTDFTQWRGRVDVLTGGFPCQPFSYAGKRGGADDDRYLWPQMCRAIQECQPTWVVGENVAGLATMVEQCEITELGAQPTLFEAVEAVPESLYEERGRYTIDRICQDLEAIGYAVQPVLIPACGVGAPHRRDRIFIIGHRNTADTADPGTESVRRERKDAVHRIETPSDTADFGQGRATDPGAESEISQKIRGQRCRAELYLSAQAASGRWPTADTDLQRRNQPEPTTEPSEEGNDSIVKRILTGEIPSGQLLPTPTTQETEHPTGRVDEKGRRWTENGKTSHSVGLADLVTDGKGFRLSPLFTEEMMGFPLMWTTFPFLSPNGAQKVSKPTETPSSRK